MGERAYSPAYRYNRGVGLPARYVIDLDWRSEDCRCCKHCGKYDTRLMKVGLRAYAHKKCFEDKYGPVSNLEKIRRRPTKSEG